MFLPTELECTECHGALDTDYRPSFVKVYTGEGVRNATSFHKKCKQCCIQYYESYSCKGSTVTYTEGCVQDKYILMSSKTAFETLYLRTISDLIEVAAVTFTSAAESYGVTHNMTFEKQRLEDAYFIYRLIQSSGNLVITRNPTSCRLDVEQACKEYLDALHLNSNEFIDHSCSVNGCAQGFVVADGIEKVS